jgi:hypothetical protein
MMPLPSMTFTTLQQLLNYINTVFVTNGANGITGDEGNSILNGLGNFINSYTLNSRLSSISSTPSIVVTLPTPITVFTQVPTSIQWVDNVQNEYYIVNATGFNIPLSAGFSYVDQFGTAQTVIPFRTAIHIAKATNGSWVQINNIGGGGSGNLPSVIGHQGQALYNNGASAFWSDNFLQIAPGDANYINATTWVNGSSYISPSFSSPKFGLFWNDIPRFLLQNVSPVEWQYVTNGFQVFEPGFNGASANVFLLFKGINS